MFLLSLSIAASPPHIRRDAIDRVLYQRISTPREPDAINRVPTKRVESCVEDVVMLAHPHQNETAMMPYSPINVSPSIQLDSPS